MYLAHLLQNKLSLCIGVIAIAVPAGGSVSVDFKQLIENPRVYQGKRVSVIGVAEVDGISFVLFQPPRRELSQKIFVGQKLGEPRYNHLNNHWVKITGIADIDEQKVFAGKIFLENVQPLPRPPVKGVDVYGVFVNEGPTPVELELFNRAGQLIASATMSPGEIHTTAIVEGQARIYTPAESLFTGKLLSSCPIGSEKSAPEFFENSSRTFYFRIKDAKIALLHPRDATALKKRSNRK
jgi:hypothetical protein